MNLLFTYILTGLLVVLGLMSLGNDFPYTPLYIILALLGLSLSFWQQKKQPLPYLRAVANIILLALTVKALYPFFAGKPKYDMFTALIATWIYFLILSTYIIRTKRDYYIIHGFSLGLIVYACFYATHNPLPLLGYTTTFLVIWIMALRNINLFPEAKEKTISYTTRDIWREIKLGAILFFAIVIISLPFYFLLPRFNIPLLPMDQLLRQRYSAIYADFPKRGLVIYLSRNPRDIMTEKKEGEGETPSPALEGGTQSQIEITPKVTKPIFWHAKEDIEKFRKNIKEDEDKLEDIAKKHNLNELKKNIQEQQKLNQQEEKINREKKELQNALQKAQEESQKLAQAQLNLPQELAQNAAALKELEDKMKSAQEQVQRLENQLKQLDAQLQKIEEAKSQIRSSVYQQAVLVAPEIRQLWDKKEEQENQLKALSQQINNLPAEQQPKPQEQPKPPEEKPKNQEAIDKLKQKIQATDQALKDLAQQNNLPDVEKNIQEHQQLLEQREKINQEKKELQNALQKARENYVKMAEIQSNPAQELAANPAALKELQDKMKNAEDKIQNMGSERRAMDKQLDKIRGTIDKIRDSVYRQSAKSTQKVRILWDKKEEQEDALKKLKEGKSTSGEEEGAGASVGESGGSTSGEGVGSGESIENQDSNRQDKGKEARTKKPGTGKAARQITILDIILYLLIIITLIYIIRSLVAFIFPYIKHKRRILHASRHSQYNLSISLIYNFLGRVLYIFGYKYPVVTLPEEYQKAMNKRFAAISHYTQDLTNLFIEARYSSHRLNTDQEKQAFENYRNILQELKNTGAAWQRHILKMWFLFEL